ncbi:S49 family peptidase [Tellurirhabdus rosea]|uniref:S49 family peptidase n=1 Tax=Tellurirhabdus rosea TaxID=2674997 RepID=UPI0022578282|nr:S49 family peptidase [Tellurirhabdus rosea]
MTGLNFSGVWAIDETAEGLLRDAMIRGAFQPSLTGISQQAQAQSGIGPMAADRVAQAYMDYLSMGANRNVAMIPIYGVMSRNSTYDNLFSNEFLIRMIRAVIEDESKVGAIVDVKSGGGSVDSADELADAIAELRQAKPVVAQVTFGASAALWAYSQSTEIQVSGGPLARVGSIGTIYMHVNQAKALEQAGLNVKIFRSAGSKDKASLNDIEPLTPEQEAAIQADLNAANKLFKSYVRRGRGNKIASDEVFTGKMYNAQNAIRLGLADRVGTIDSAYKRVIQLSKSK